MLEMDYDNKFSYILVTPAKNEEKNLPEVINSVVSQTILPKVWVVVDDGSIDRTTEILKTYSEKYNWIKYVRINNIQKNWDVHLNYARVCNIGFSEALKFCEKFGIKYEYIGLQDADTVVEREYYEKLMRKFIENPKLGIASGGIYYKTKRGLIWERTPLDFPRGSGRLWRKNCFFETGGYALDPAMHTISNVKAILKGYETRQFKEIIAVELRKTGSSGGYGRRAYKTGTIDYYLYKPFRIVLAKSLYYAINYPFYPALFYLAGYVSSAISRSPRITDEDIKKHFQSQSLTKTFKKLFLQFLER
ncbi:MAG: glycosyltransferase family 2 protein [Archaeoglobaceae archaeon]